MTRLTLIRHGEPTAAARGTHYGDGDVELSERGREQSVAVAARLAGEVIDAVWSSNLVRARYLADLLAAPRGLSVRVDPDLRERGVGIFQGLTYAEAEAAHPQAARDLRYNAADHLLPGGENMRDLAARVLPALGRIRADHPDQHVALAGHGGPIRIVLGHALGMPVEELDRIRLDYCRVSTVEFRPDGRMRVTRVNA